MKGLLCGERGSGLVLCTVLMAVLIVLTASFVAYSTAQSKAAVTRLVAEDVRQAAEGGVGIAITQVDRQVSQNQDVSSTLSGTLASGAAAGATWRVEVKQSTTDSLVYKLTSAARLRDTYMTHQVIIRMPPPPAPPVPGAFKGALSSYYGFPDLKNIHISGNDVKSADGSANADGADTFGVSIKTGSVSQFNTSGSLAGNGQAPADSVDSNRVQTDYGGQTFPKTPLEALGLAEFPPNTRTFNTLAEWNSFVSSLPFYDANGDGTIQSSENKRRMPDYQLLNLTFKDGSSTMFDEVDWGDTEHILVWHHENSTVNSDPNAPKGDAGCNNIHLGNSTRTFRGIAILDDWRHVNGGSNVRGGFISLSGTGAQTGLQGNTQITYSSEAIGNAMARAGQVGGSQDRDATVVSWREGVDDAESRAALAALGLTLAGSPSEVSSGWQDP
jgi:hypothetical protein